ncbi:uncharacterized protein C9orf152-like isoform X2 [Trichomycterus rosablanca]|uniref:uncharacterized protein C9orf152-like isoform X2 n=1 Tax=Trichomycterus rosablanca TaxID=2290929 RepID=UPI002F357F8E
MDIAVLKEQYNSIREKQRHETRVICFRKESDNEDICGKTLVNLVPMRQDQPSLMRPASLQDNHVDFNRDPDSATWRTHLIMYRRSCLTSDTSQLSKVNTSTKDTTSSVSVNNAECSLEEADLSHHLSKDCDETETGSLLVNKELNNCESKDLRFRKCSAPMVLTRQLSCGSYRSGHNPESPCYYPFPQLKSPRKSEAARRLGLYSSF